MMAYTVKQLSVLSGVSVRTLHFYDQKELLKPSFVGENGYRFYEERELLLLQQILFFRELGFELNQIRELMVSEDFDQIETLKAHRKVLFKKRERLKELIGTIDSTIQKLKGGSKMKDKEIFKGFDPEKQAEYEQYMKNRYGDHPAFGESRKNTKGWTKADWERTSKEWESIVASLAESLKKSHAPSSKEVQEVIGRHYRWLKNFWTPNRESYVGLGIGYTGFEWKQAFERYDRAHPKLALLMSEAMKCFAEKNL